MNSNKINICFLINVDVNFHVQKNEIQKYIEKKFDKILVEEFYLDELNREVIFSLEKPIMNSNELKTNFFEKLEDLFNHFEEYKPFFTNS